MTDTLYKRWLNESYGLRTGDPVVVVKSRSTSTTAWYVTSPEIEEVFDSYEDVLTYLNPPS